MAGAVTFVGDGISAEAAADLSSLQFRFAKMSGVKVNKATAASDPIIGILQNKAKSGKTASVKVMGGSKLEVDAGTDIAAGDQLTSDSVGRGIKTTTENNTCGAIALEAATNAGEIISVLIVNFSVSG